jgi:hypothetical protein
MTDQIRRDSQRLGALLQDVTLVPTPEQRKVKATYWTRLHDNPVYDRDTTTCASALEITGDTRVSRWWSLDGFQDWFANKDEFRARVEYLAHLALDTVEDVLLDQDANANARMKAVQIVLEAAAKFPTKASGEEKYLDARIQKMSQFELEAYIARSLPAPAAAKDIELDSTEKK